MLRGDYQSKTVRCERRAEPAAEQTLRFPTAPASGQPRTSLMGPYREPVEPWPGTPAQPAGVSARSWCDRCAATDWGVGDIGGPTKGDGQELPASASLPARAPLTGSPRDR